MEYAIFASAILMSIQGLIGTCTGRQSQQALEQIQDNQRDIQELITAVKKIYTRQDKAESSGGLLTPSRRRPRRRQSSRSRAPIKSRSSSEDVRIRPSIFQNDH